MAYEERNNSGSMFPNARKEQDNHPDWEGSIMVDGKSYWLKAWNKQGQKGPWVSLSVKDKVARAEQISNEAGFGKTPPRQPSYADQSGSFDRNTGEVFERGRTPYLDDEIPFAAEFR